ncbi:MAG: ABC transporter ATP-binding protein [Candidatus Nitrospinota bacterium M3_3B_026]
MPPIVEGENVVKRYGGLTAVDDVSFTVERGEFFGFLGPNGAGKTSVMKMIQCVSPVTSGSITVDGMRAGEDDRRIKAILGVAPQEDNLDTDLAVIENLEVYAGYFDIPRREARARAFKLLEFLHLEEKSGTRIRALSGGMKRRLTIARALINNPRILILDEPTTGLDPQARRVIWQKLESLRNEGVTLLLTTHYMEEAERLLDRVGIMDGGKILLTGRPAALVEEVIGEEVIEAAAPFGGEKGVERELLAMELDFTRTPETFLVFGAGARAARERLGRIEGVRIFSRRATLEDLFLKMTGHELKSGG